MAAGTGAPLVVIAAADARDGTNALLLSPPDIIEPHFGPGSLEAHLRAARDAGATVQLVVDPRGRLRPRHAGRPGAPRAGPAGGARGPWRGRRWPPPERLRSRPCIACSRSRCPALPEVRQGDDLAALIAAAWRELMAAEPDLAPRAGDVLVVTQKIVSKAEGAVVDLRTVDPATGGGRVRRALGPRPAPGGGRAARGGRRRAHGARRPHHAHPARLRVCQRRRRCLQRRARHA